MCYDFHHSCYSCRNIGTCPVRSAKLTVCGLLTRTQEELKP